MESAIPDCVEPDEDQEREQEEETIEHVPSYLVEAEELVQLVQSLSRAESTREESKTERICAILDKYQEQPQLLDKILSPCLQHLMDVVKESETADTSLNSIFRIIYFFCKVRGYKTCLKFFPHHVSELEPSLQMLESMNEQPNASWEARYCLLLWLSMLVLVPFDLDSIDSSLASSSSLPTKTLADRLLNVCQMYLKDPGPPRDAAAVLLSRFLTRPDISTATVRQVFDWSNECLESSEDVFLTTGIYDSLSAICKHCQRQEIRPFASAVLHRVKLSAESNPSILQRKLAMKLAQRLALLSLKPRVITWRYQQGSRSLLENLRHTGPDKGTSANAGTALADATGLDDEDIEVPPELEDVIELLLSGLNDKDTVVRWSAAKGLGRLCGRLTAHMADDVVSYMLGIMGPNDSDASWHGACLALAELSRRGLLLPSRLPAVFPLILKALEFDQVRGAHGVGAHVRDAACYVCWAFGRAYSAEVMQPYMRDMARGLLCAAVFDREVNCRRAASAAFQENVGRQGAFPHGIDILTAADYYTVGVRSNAYLSVSVFLAQFVEYREALVDHLLRCKVAHWDPNIRDLCSRALGRLTPLLPAYMCEMALPQLVPLTVSPDLSQRHGATLAVAEISRALPEASKELPPDLMQQIVDIVGNVEKARLYRGRGGEIMRSAVCRLITCLSQITVPAGTKTISLWLSTVDECLKHPNESIQNVAISACKALCSQYLSASPTQKTLAETVERFAKFVQSNDNPAIRRGYAAALGTLPPPLLLPRLPLVLDTLISAIGTSVQESQKDGHAEARRNCIVALITICENIPIVPMETPESDGCSSLIPSHLKRVQHSLLVALGDYSVDNRGDVGSWVREAAMRGLKSLLVLMCKVDEQVPAESPRLVDEPFVREVFAGLLKQLSEKIDRVRKCAGSVLHQLLHYAEPRVSHVPHRTELEAVFPRSCEVNWAAPASTFPLVVPLLRLPSYRRSVLSGLVISIGGLTESTIRSSWSSFSSVLLQVVSSDHLLLHDILGDFLDLFDTYKNLDRVIIPLFKTLDLVISSGALKPVASQLAEFSTRLVDISMAEVASSKDVVKALASINLVCGLMEFPDPTSSKALSFATSLLRSKFPKVRRNTASELYTRCITTDGFGRISDEALDDILTLLTSTAWDGPLPGSRPNYESLCSLLGVSVRPLAPRKEQQAATSSALLGAGASEL